MNDTVFTFGGNAPHSNARQKDKTVTGGKGANLAEMASIGLPVPPGFTIATEECLNYLAGGSTFPKSCERTSPTHCATSKKQWARALAMRPIRCSSRSARARRFRCRA